MRTQGMLAAGVMAGAMVFVTGAACAQEYPTRPIRIITTAAGGGGDFTARQIAQGITGPLGQQVIVDNRVTGIVATEAAAKAPPDGYTLTLGGRTWIPPLLLDVPYDVERDLAPITQVEKSVHVVAVHPSVPANTVRELIALTKAKPGELNYGAISAAGSLHFSVEMLVSAAGMQMTRIPYKGAAPVIAALLKGEVQMTVNDAAQLMPQAKAGKVKVLAVTSPEPTPLVPGVPAAGVPGYEYVNAAGLWAPVKTPTAIINRLHQEVVRHIVRPEVRERFLAIGVEVVGSSPAEFAAFIRDDTVKAARIIKESGTARN